MIDVLTDPQIWLLILVISALDSLARLANFYAGQRGKEKIEAVYTKIKLPDLRIVQQDYSKLAIGGVYLVAAVILIASSQDFYSVRSLLENRHDKVDARLFRF